MWIALIAISLLVLVQQWIILGLINRLLAQAKLPPLELPKRQPEPEQAEPPRRKIASIPFLS